MRRKSRSRRSPILKFENRADWREQEIAFTLMLTLTLTLTFES